MTAQLVLIVCGSILLALGFAFLVYQDRYRGVGVLAISYLTDPRVPRGKAFFLSTTILELPPAPEIVSSFARDDLWTDTYIIDRFRVTGTRMALGIIKGITT